MSYYKDIYLKRLNRYGNSYKSRMQGQRERLFNAYLKRSVYTINFTYNDQVYIGSFEPNKQDNTQTLQFLLTTRDLNIPNGTILNIPIEGQPQNWLVYYKEYIEASGYNKYTLLRMTHTITWTGRDKQNYTSLAYFYGQENNMLKDELKSRSRSDVLYTENLKLSFLVMPLNTNLNKDDYFQISIGNVSEGYRVTGYDRISTEGIQFVSVDPTYLYDLTPAPEPTPEEQSDPDFYWIQGGLIDGE